MSKREGCLAILVEKSVEHYDVAQNRLFIDITTLLYGLMYWDAIVGDQELR